MRLINILNKLGQLEKSSFLKLIDGLSSELRKSNKKIDKILSESEGSIKNIDNTTAVNIFELMKKHLLEHFEEELQINDMQLDIIIDIIIRDGNSIMSRDWFAKLYDKEIASLQHNLRSFSSRLIKDEKSIDNIRKRDYNIFRECVRTAYENDELVNRDKKITNEEKTILNTLSQGLNLSIEEKRLIYFDIVPLIKLEIDEIIKTLKEIGILFYKMREYTLYVPDEIVWILRELKNIELPNKYFRRILRQLSDSEINRIAKNHQIDIKLSRVDKIKTILQQGISVKNALLQDIHKENISKKDTKFYLQNLINKYLKLDISKLGTTAEERVSILIEYFQNLEKDENIGMSLNGFSKMLLDLSQYFPKLNKLSKTEFELHQSEVLDVDLLIDYNIKPHEILDLIPNNELIDFCKKRSLKFRGNVRMNIIESYKDVENLLIENYEYIGKRDLKSLREKDIFIKEAELGMKYEEITKKIFEKCGFNVNEGLRKKINTKRHQIDILLDLGKNEVIIVECKTQKEGDFNKYSSVSRQLLSYDNLCENNGFRVLRILLVSPDFSQDFIEECEYDSNLNLSLISSAGLLEIMYGFIKSRKSEFPINLLRKGGKLNATRIVDSINR